MRLPLLRLAFVMLLGLAAAACAGGPRAGVPTVRAITAAAAADPAPVVSGTMRPYQIRGRWYRPAEQPGYDEIGLASWYGDAFNGRPTATGERFDMHALTAAHKTLPLPGLVEVTNLENGRSAVLRVNDRGPFVDGRIIDLSRGSAEALGLLSAGVGRVRVRYLGQAPRSGGGVLLAEATPTQSARVTRAEPAVWVQAAVFSDRGAADRSREALGRSARVEPDAGRYRVVLGPWPDANQAERARQAAIAYGFADAFLIPGR
jgi:rare lipoprotein A